jgi:integrase/recombinase XerD
VQLGERVCSGPEQFKAWLQNLGHEDVMVTYRSYGEVPLSRQAEIISSLNGPNEVKADPVKFLKTLERLLMGENSNTRIVDVSYIGAGDRKSPVP